MEILFIIFFIDVWITNYRHLKRIEALEKKNEALEKKIEKE